ncbi:ATP-dependent helicase [uncultured Pseudomonas sp.]|uniref:UvrD-helicase domain-containing protein n=1 Tax=uncultured Pseudomonas sp. TaxID=114707 RepID=UPI0025ECD2E0|nr:ATP-dependent helicase [uncultured Pseudomonas sp.]
MVVRIQFTQAQIDAIESKGSMVITACPGSGKTTLIVEKIRQDFHALKEFQGIIGISFTIKASSELHAKCRRNGANVRFSFFGTIDNFCLAEIVYPFVSRIFGKGPTELCLRKYSEIEQSYQDCLPDLSQSGITLNKSDFDLYHDEFLKHYNAGFLLLEAITVIAGAIVEKSRACRRYLIARYKAIYIDEYQDTSPAQHALFCAIHELGLKAVAVGDIQQSIYGFRGSDPQYLLSLVHDSINFEHHIIDINHRCHPSIVNYANRLYSHSCIISPVELKDIRMYRGCFSGTQEDVAVKLSQWIIDSAKKLEIKDFCEIAVLTRWNNSIERLQEHLTIPARFYKDDELSKLSGPVVRFITALLKYYLDESKLVQEVLDEFQLTDKSQLRKVRSLISGLRKMPVEELECGFEEISRHFKVPKLSDQERHALSLVLNSSEALSHYSKVHLGEVQVMTLHKSKGLEFDMVVHLDLYDWVFPTREYTGNFSEEVFPEWEQDLNLHYVGITRARKWCVLVTSSYRLNSYGQTKVSKVSQFYNLPGLEGLYQ